MLFSMLFALDSTSILLVTAVVLLLVTVLCNHRSGQVPYPPGPILNHLPIFGYLPFLAKRPAHIVFTKLAKQYGKIFHVKLGSQRMVILCDAKLFRDTFKRDDLIGRPHNPLNDGVMDGYGISSAEGGLWKTQRRFAQTTLRDLGMLRSISSNKIRFEENAMRAVEIMLEEIRKMDGKAFDPEFLLGFTVANIFCSMVVSKTFPLYEPGLMFEIEELADSFKIIEGITIANFIRIFCYLPQFHKILKTILRRRDATREFFRKIIEEHRAQLDPENPRDLIDSFLVQMDQDQRTGAPTHFTELQLVSMLGDMFSAGTETTKTTMRWLILAMATNPHIQQKLQQELDDVIGRNRCPRTDDLIHLPYTNAVILETLRWSSALVIGNPHCPARDITIEGYHVPKGSLVTGLLWMFHRDEAVWKNAHQFDPENFLLENGKRQCVGEDLAKTEVFLMSTNLLQNFTFVPSVDEKDKLPSLEESKKGFLRSPLPYKICANPRSFTR